MLPMIDFYGTRVTRLILGDNPFLGYSYIQDEHSGDEMADFHTAHTIVRTLFEAEENGVNTYMALADPFILRVIRQYRNEGGKMNIMFQTCPSMDLEVNIRQMMACEPIGIYHQGGTLDTYLSEDRVDELMKRLSAIRACGVKAGLGTHVPETVIRAEREGWGMEFYMTCLYNPWTTRKKGQRGFIPEKPDQLGFYPEDPPLMYEAIRATKKPCIAFKIFAGGQIFFGKKADEIPAIAESAFADVYGNIKPDDMVCIGVFQKHKDQLKENADIARRVMDR